MKVKIPGKKTATASKEEKSSSRVKIARKRGSKSSSGNGSDSYVLLIWDHYRASTCYYLIPRRKLSDEDFGYLVDANGFYITEKISTEAPVKVRGMLSSFEPDFAVRVDTIAKEDRHISRVIHTGQWS